MSLSLPWRRHTAHTCPTVLQTGRRLAEFPVNQHRPSSRSLAIGVAPVCMTAYLDGHESRDGLIQTSCRRADVAANRCELQDYTRSLEPALHAAKAGRGGVPTLSIEHGVRPELTDHVRTIVSSTLEAISTETPSQREHKPAPFSPIDWRAGPWGISAAADESVVATPAQPVPLDRMACRDARVSAAGRALGGADQPTAQGTDRRARQRIVNLSMCRCLKTQCHDASGFLPGRGSVEPCSHVGQQRLDLRHQCFGHVWL